VYWGSFAAKSVRRVRTDASCPPSQGQPEAARRVSRPEAIGVSEGCYLELTNDGVSRKEAEEDFSNVRR